MGRFVLIPVVTLSLLWAPNAQINAQDACTTEGQPYILETLFEGTISEDNNASTTVDVGGCRRYALLGRFEGPPNETFQLTIYNSGLGVHDEHLTLNSDGWLNYAEEYTVYAPDVHVVLYHPPANFNVDLTLYATMGATSLTDVFQSATWVIAQDEGQLTARNADGDTDLCKGAVDAQNLSWLLSCAIGTPNVPKTVFVRRGKYQFSPLDPNGKPLYLPDSSYCVGLKGEPPKTVDDTEGCHYVHMRDNVTVVLERGVTFIVPHGYRGSVFSFHDGVGSASLIGGRITEKTEPSLKQNPKDWPWGERCGGPTFEDTQGKGQWTDDGNGCVLRRWRAIQLESLHGGQPNYNSVRDVIIWNADVGIDLLVRSEADPKNCPSDKHGCYKLDEDTGQCTVEPLPKGNIAGNEFRNVQVFGPRSAFIRFRHEGPRECMHGINRNYFDHVRGDATLDTPLGAEILGGNNTFVEVKFWEVEKRYEPDYLINPDPYTAKIGKRKTDAQGNPLKDAQGKLICEETSNTTNTLIVGGLMTAPTGSQVPFLDCGKDTQIIDEWHKFVAQ